MSAKRQEELALTILLGRLPINFCGQIPPTTAHCALPNGRPMATVKLWSISWFCSWKKIVKTCKSCKIWKIWKKQTNLAKSSCKLKTGGRRENCSCVVNERFISPFRGTYNDNDLRHVTLYAYLKAFRFTGSPVLYLECEIHMCQNACPVSRSLAQFLLASHMPQLEALKFTAASPPGQQERERERGKNN